MSVGRSAVAARNDMSRVTEMKSLGGPEYELTVKCSGCDKPFTYTAIRINVRSKNGGAPKFNLKGLCDNCRHKQKHSFETQVREGYVTEARRYYIEAVTPGSQLSMHLPSPAHPAKPDRDPRLEYPWLRLADDECKHGRLPGDKDDPCGCFSLDEEWAAIGAKPTPEPVDSPNDPAREAPARRRGPR